MMMPGYGVDSAGSALGVRTSSRFVRRVFLGFQSVQIIIIIHRPACCSSYACMRDLAFPNFGERDRQTPKGSLFPFFFSSAIINEFSSRYKTRTWLPAR
jgi:hypothetical protein